MLWLTINGRDIYLVQGGPNVPLGLTVEWTQHDPFEVLYIRNETAAEIAIGPLSVAGDGIITHEHAAGNRLVLFDAPSVWGPTASYLVVFTLNRRAPAPKSVSLWKSLPKPTNLRSRLNRILGKLAFKKSPPSSAKP